MTTPATVPPTLELTGGHPLAGRVRTPGDKSISHRALLLAALAEGASSLRGLSSGDDVARTRSAVAALGAQLEAGGPGEWRVVGGGARLAPALAPIDCGNSGTSLRLLMGVVAGLPGPSRLTGDESLSARPMDRVAVPLRRMGAGVEGRGERCLPPVAVTGGRLTGIRWEPPMASAQVKSCVLLAGLRADGETTVHEPVPTRAHTEEMLADAGAAVEVAEDARSGARTVTVRRSRLRPLDLTVPGDPSQAAFWVVAGTIVPGSEVQLDPVYGGPARTGFLGVLQRMGARIEAVAVAAGGHSPELRLVARSSELTGTEVAAAEIPSLDEVPVLAVAAACAEGTTTFRDVGELRVKESDRMRSVAGLVDAFGARAEVRGDDLVVHGAGPGGLHGGQVAVHGDHRIAMAAAVAALAATGPSTVTGFDTVGTSYPGFVSDLVALGGRITPDNRAPGSR